MSVFICLMMALLLASSIRCQCTNRDCGGETCETSTQVTQLLEKSLLQQEEMNKQLQKLSEKVDMVNDQLKQCATNIEPKPIDCSEVEQNGSGVYVVYPKGSSVPMEVFCNQTVNGGGWMVIQRRMDGSTEFYRNWKDYSNGFGNLEKEFWMGNDKISMITSQRHYRLRIDLEDFDGKMRFAEYSHFRIDEFNKYKLQLGAYSGDAGDSLTYHNGLYFSTHDQDNDVDGSNCAQKYKAAWWYRSCHSANLNGQYKRGEYSGTVVDGVVWDAWRGQYYSLKFTQMMLRPWDCTN